MKFIVGLNLDVLKVAWGTSTQIIVGKYLISKVN